ncbi:MAG: FKBP-type peptidyl-prolyl cis-trans isomerase [Paludibacteraceae bacterium]
MKLKYLSIAVAILSVTLLTVSCEKSDSYIDWKVMNDNWYESHKTDAGFTVTQSGLSYRRTSPPAGESERKPNAADAVWVDYTGKYIDGTEFDSGTSSIFYLSGSGSIITGLAEGILQMRRGETFEFYIPHTIAYGDEQQGLIPPYSTLIFTITLLDSKSY